MQTASISLLNKILFLKINWTKSLNSLINIFNPEKRASQLYQSMFKNSHSVMLLIDPCTGQILDANRSASMFYGYTKDDLIKKKITAINTLSPELTRMEMYNAEIESRNQFQFKHRLANGEIRDVEVFSSPVVVQGKKVLYSIIYDVSERLKLERERDENIRKLEKARQEIEQLKGILPLCSFCKKIRDSENSWQPVDLYIHKHSEAEISHSICPECYKKHYGELLLNSMKKIH